MKQNRWIKRMLHAGIQTLILLVGITFLSFLLSWLSPGDAAERMLKKSGMMVTEEQLEAKREELGIDQPLLVQYKNWLVKLCKGDLGTSYKSKKEVVQELAKNLPYTAALTAVAMLLVILISLPVGILCAQHRNGLFDNIWSDVSVFFPSILFCGIAAHVCSGSEARTSSGDRDQKLERDPDAGTGSCPDTVRLVYPSGSGDRAEGALQRVYRWPEEQRNIPAEDPFRACTEKQHAAAGDTFWNIHWKYDGRNDHCGEYLFLAGSRENGRGCHQLQRLSGDPGLCGLDGTYFSGDQFCSRCILPVL